MGSGVLKSAFLRSALFLSATLLLSACGGGGSSSDEPGPDLDTTAPAVPSFVKSIDTYINTESITLSGTGEAGSVITVYQSGNEIGSATVSDNGEWSMSIDNLNDGEHTYTITAEDTAGNVSGASAELIITVDTTAPDAPVITIPPAVIINETGLYILSGTAEAGSEVTVFQAGIEVGSSITSDNGEWSLSVNHPTEGEYIYTVRVKDVAGNTSDISEVLKISVDTTVPDVPVILSPEAGLRSDGTFSVSGIAEANATVIVFQSGFEVASVTSFENGGWSFALDDLPDGSYIYTAIVEDAAGNESDLSAGLAVTVDSTPPNAPVVNTSAGGLTRVGEFTVFGTAEAGATVTVYQSGFVIGSVAALDNGSWSVPVSGLADGSYVYNGTAEDAAGNVSDLSIGYRVVVDSTPPAAPAINLPSDNLTSVGAFTLVGTAEAGASVTVFQSGVEIGSVTASDNGGWSYVVGNLEDGNYAYTATAEDVAGNVSVRSAEFSMEVDSTSPAAPTVTSSSNNPSKEGVFTLSGTAEPGANVRLFQRGVDIGFVTALEDGSWSKAVSNLSDGSYVYTATAEDAAGNVSGLSVEFLMVVDSTPPDKPLITEPASGLTKENGITLSGTAEAGATVTVFESEIEIGSASVSENGEWAVAVMNLSDGSYAYTATAEDAAGNVSSVSATFEVTVDTVPPSAPVISSPALTKEGAFTVTGSAEAGATVTVSEAGSEINSVVALGNGSWSLPVSVLDDGTYTYTATATDPAGNVSGISAEFIVTVDSALPDPPVINSPSAGLKPSSGPFIVSGTAELGATVTVFQSGVSIGSPIAADGNWSVETGILEDGGYTFTASAEDMAGNVSGESEGLDIEVDTTAPNAPVIISPDSGVLKNTGSFTLSGTAEAGAEIKVFESGNELVTGAASEVGNWEIGLVGQADGEHLYTAVARDAAGNVSEVSATVTVTVDTTAPAAPVIVSPSNGLMSKTGSFTVVVDAEAGSTVKLFQAGTEIASLTAELGEWAKSFEGLDDGEYVYTARAIDEAENISDESVAITVTVDTVPPTVPVITPPDSNLTNSTESFTLSGMVEEPGVLITVYQTGPESDSKSINASDTGDWSLQMAGRVTDGDYVYTATATDAAGNESARSAEVTITLDTIPPEVPVILTPEPGVTKDTGVFTASGTSEPGVLVTVYQTGPEESSKSINASDIGEWSLPMDGRSTEGDYVYTATATDAIGNESDPSAERTITLDTTPPSAPVITSLAAYTNDVRPVISGIGAEAGSNVQVYVDDVWAGETTAQQNGDWSFSLQSDLVEGGNNLAVSAIDLALNESLKSSVHLVTVDTVAPSILGAPVPDANISLSTDINFSFATATDASSGVDYYQVRISTTEDFSSDILFEGVANGTSNHLYYGQPTLTYYAQVRAVDVAGNAASWSTSSAGVYIERGAFQSAYHIAGDDVVVSDLEVDASGNTLIAGHFYHNMEFGNDVQPDTRSAGESEDAYVIKFNQSGEVLWDWHVASAENITTYGRDRVRATDIAIDGEGSVYVIGYFSGSMDFDPSVNSDVFATPATRHFDNIFLTKLDSSGNYQWTITYSDYGSSWDYAFGVVTDSNNDIYITGGFTSYYMDFDPGAGTNLVYKLSGTSPLGGADTFVSKLTKDGAEIWTQTFGAQGSGDLAGVYGYSAGHKMVLSSDESKLILSGSYAGIIDFTPLDGAATGQHYTADSSTEKLYAAQLNASTGAYEWSYQIDAWSDDVKETTWNGTENAGSWVTTNNQGDVFVTSYFKGDAEFNGVLTPSILGSNDILVTKLSSTGAHLWTNVVGSSGDDRVGGIALDSLGAVYITGKYSGTVDFNSAVDGDDSRTAIGSFDAFVSRINSDGSYGWTRTFESAGGGSGNGQAITIDGARLLSTGQLTGTADFDPDDGIETRGIENANSAYVSELALGQ